MSRVYSHRYARVLSAERRSGGSFVCKLRRMGGLVAAPAPLLNAARAVIGQCCRRESLLATLPYPPAWLGVGRSASLAHECRLRRPRYLRNIAAPPSPFRPRPVLASLHMRASMWLRRYPCRLSLTPPQLTTLRLALGVIGLGWGRPELLTMSRCIRALPRISDGRSY